MASRLADEQKSPLARGGAPKTNTMHPVFNTLANMRNTKKSDSRHLPGAKRLFIAFCPTLVTSWWLKSCRLRGILLSSPAHLCQIFEHFVAKLPTSPYLGVPGAGWFRNNKKLPWYYYFFLLGRSLSKGTVSISRTRATLEVVRHTVLPFWAETGFEQRGSLTPLSPNPAEFHSFILVSLFRNTASLLAEVAFESRYCMRHSPG